MKYTDKESLLEELSLNKNASVGYDEYPKEDMESLTFYESKNNWTTNEFDTRLDYESDFFNSLF